MSDVSADAHLYANPHRNPLEDMGNTEWLVRSRAQDEHGCGCGYWVDGKLLRPHAKCACHPAVELRKELRREPDSAR